MQYRSFGKTDFRPSVLGFGCMRLPTRDGEPQSADIDEPQAIGMIRRAIDRGVNFLDTAYVYHNGRSEVVLGRALENGYRERVRVSSKSPVWLIKKTGDFDKYLNEQLKRLRTDRIDFYLLHGLGQDSFEPTVLRLKLIEAAEKAKQDGRIGHIGFSFHDEHAVFRKIVDAYDGWEFCLLQHNYMDIANQAGSEGVRYAASKGLGIMVMEPLLGGRLANPPRFIRDMFEAHPDKNSPAGWALRWLWDIPEVSSVFSGMSDMAQVEQNLALAESAGKRNMTPEDRDLIARVREAYRSRIPIPCTNCGYCLPCPNGVAIPKNFELYNDGFIHEDVGRSRLVMQWFVKAEERPGVCTACKECEELCPQKIPIADMMTKVREVLEEGKPYPAKV